jgi:hypothetical protein
MKADVNATKCHAFSKRSEEKFIEPYVEPSNPVSLVKS